MTPPFVPEEPDMGSSVGPPLTMAQKPAAPRLGFFGRLGNALRRVDWERVGAAMRDDPTYLQQLMQERQNAAETARQAAEAEAQRRAAKGQNQQVQDWIGTLDPSLQTLAQIAPAQVAASQVPMGPEDRAAADFRERQFQETMRHNRATERSAASGGNDGAYRVLTPQEVQAHGLPPGSYQLNTRTNQVVPIGRVRSQYTEFAGQSAQFASRMAHADELLRRLEDTVDPALVYGSAWGGGSPEVRQIRQAQREFVNSVLRRESGAAIQPSEFESARQQYFPVPGDDPGTIERKRQARELAIRGLMNASQGAYEEWYGGDQAPAESAGATQTPSGANRRQRGPIGSTSGAVIRYDAQGRRIP